jgi:serine protease Do
MQPPTAAEWASSGSGGFSAQFSGDFGEIAELERAVIERAVLRASRSVVRLEWVGGRTLLWEALPGGAVATGTIVSSQGWIVASSYFFLDRPGAILARFPDGQVLPARMLGRDLNRMITLLKVERDCSAFVPMVCPPAEIEVGMRTVAIGWTLAEEPDVAVGILSAKRRIWGKAVQTDARTSPRNYGGPLVDLRGRVIGIVVPLSPDGKDPVAGAQWYDSGIGFAVPMGDLPPVLARLASGEDLFPARLGVQFPPVNPVLAEPLVQAVERGSAAEQAGLRPGDRIRSLAGVAIRRVSDAEELLQRHYGGDSLRIEWEREGSVLQAEVVLEKDKTVLERGGDSLPEENRR